MPFGKIKNNALHELKYGLIDNAKRFKKTAIELRDLAWRSILYMELAGYGVELPKEPDELIQLNELDLSGKGIDKLPAGIGHLTQLTKLDLSDNNLTKLPKEIGHLTQLTKLDLSDNNLTKLPKEIGHLTQLTELYIAGNNLTKLPKQIENLTQLHSLSLPINMPITDFISRTQSKSLDNLCKKALENQKRNLEKTYTEL